MSLQYRGRITSMKILYTNFHEGYGGGQITYIATLCDHLKSRHSIWVATPTCSDLYDVINTMKVNTLGVKFKHGLFDFRAKWHNAKILRNFVNSEKIDVIHVNGSADHRLVRLALLANKHQPKIIFTKHNSFTLKPSSKNRLKKACNTIISVSEFTTKQLIDQGISASKIKTIYNGIDSHHYQPSDKESRKKIRQDIGINDNEIVLGSVAGNATYKGWQYLIQALSTLRDRRFRVILAGEKISEELYQKLIVANELEDTVIFPGKLDDVRKIIPAFDVGFVLSDAVETISFACREMMAMGVPVLVSDYAGLPENITPGVDGWVTPTADVDALVEFLPNIFITDLAAMKTAARKKAVQEFDVNIFVDKTEACYVKTGTVDSCIPNKAIDFSA